MPAFVTIRARPYHLAWLLLAWALLGDLGKGQRLPARQRHAPAHHPKREVGALRKYDLTNIVHTLSYWHSHKPAIYFSANGADLAVEQLFFGRQTGGTFVEFGGFGFHGDAMSDTLLFERYRQWRGVLFEAYLDNFSRARQRRPGALWVGKPVCIEGSAASGGGQFVPAEGKLLSGACEPIGPVLRRAGIDAVDLLSLSLDGYEAPVLEHMLDWSIPVRVVVVAMPRGRQAQAGNGRARAALLARGFEEERRVLVKDTGIFVNPAYTPPGAR
eukprot:jgi/Tetstr1/432084/TSEL_021555.t1